MNYLKQNPDFHTYEEIALELQLNVTNINKRIKELLVSNQVEKINTRPIKVKIKNHQLTNNIESTNYNELTNMAKNEFELTNKETTNNKLTKKNESSFDRHSKEWHDHKIKESELTNNDQLTNNKLTNFVNHDHESKKDLNFNGFNFNLNPEETIKYKNYSPSSDEVRISYKYLTGKSPSHKTGKGDIETMLHEMVYATMFLWRKYNSIK